MKRGVILVHGYMDSNSTLWWNRIEDFLLEVGYSVKSVDLGGVGTTVESPIKYAHEIRDCVIRLDNLCADCETIDIIAHSMGGIAARWYIEEMDGNERVDSITTLGTPHRGTLTAYLGSFSKGGKQLTPSSTVIKRLNSKGLADDVEYHLIQGEKDNVVVPSENAALPDYGSTENVHNYSINCGHIRMVFSLDKFKTALSMAGIL